MCPIYEFECLRCCHINEEYHPMGQSPKETICPYCLGEGFEGRAVRIISLPHTHKDRLYNFIDYNTTGRPVVINSKGQWKRHLKQHGLHDDISQSPMKRGDLKEGMNVDKNRMKRELKDTIGKAIMDKKHMQETKQKILNSKGG